jgi:3-phosphoshikimate 1-carboxyvinyltransferase
MIEVPGDKSISHRALLLGVLSGGRSSVRGLLNGEDCQSTARVLRALGARLPPLPDDGSEFGIEGVGLHGLGSPTQVLDCGNSGTTARLLLGLLAGLPVEATLTGDLSLQSRPMRRVTQPLGSMGARFEDKGEPDRLPLTVKGGKLSSFSYRSPVASAQIKSALLLASVTGGVPLEVEEPHRSRDHTERMLRRMGVTVEEEEGPSGWRVRIPDPPKELAPLRFHVPGDFSSAAFLVAFGLMGGSGEELRIKNVGLNPTRTGLLDVLRAMGAEIRVEDGREEGEPAGEPAGTLVVSPSELRGTSVGGAMIPLLLDEIPILAVLAARAEGVTEIRDAAELRVKESDRLNVIAGNLRTLGAKVEELPDGLRIRGAAAPLEGRVSVHRDHRIAMAFGVLGALPNQRVTVDDPGAADVSFPGFWELLTSLSAGTGAKGGIGQA